MKRVITSMLLILTFALTLVFVSAEEDGTGNLIIHYQNTTGDYSDVGLNSWNHDADGIGGVQNPESLKEITKTDDFGVYWELKDVTIEKDKSIGFQVVGFNNPNDSDPDWDNKKYTDHEISSDILVDGETVHVYMFYGSNTRTNEEATPEPIPYLYTNPLKHNLILTYFDQSNAYDDNLGLHNWGWTNISGANWGSPNKVLKNVGKDLTGTPIKGVVLEYDYKEGEENDYGVIVYAGGDNNKKTGDIKIDEIFAEVSPKGLGEADVIQVYNDGDGNTSNENVILNDAEKYILEAYSFNLVPMFNDEGEYKGTFAPNPNQVIAELNSSVMAPIKLDEDGKKVEITNEEKTTEIMKWFKVLDEDDNEVVIDDIHYDAGASSLRSFVLILGEDLDNTKEYTLKFDLGLEGEENKAAEILVDMDKEAPQIQFISPSSFANETDPDKRIIEVAWNKKFDQNLFPRFVVTDDRDGDITRMVYVPKGDYSILNTNVEGDYKIMLRVEDSWGNVTEETFIFRVTKKVK